MKFLALLLSCILLLMNLPASAADVVLSWNANTESDLAGYKIYQSTISGQYGAPVATVGKVTSQTLTLPQLDVDVTYFFTLTAHDLAGNDSPKSLEVSKTIPKIVIAPVTLTLTLQGDPAVGAWAILAAVSNPPAEPYAVEVYVNGVYHHTENADPRCSWGDPGGACSQDLLAPGTYVVEFRVIKNALEVARQSMSVLVPVVDLAPAAPTGLVVQ